MSEPSDDRFFEQLAESDTALHAAPDALKIRLLSALEARGAEDAMFGELAASTPTVKAPASMKSRIYSALMRKQAQDHSLLGLSASKEAGWSLCIFEDLVTIAPVGQKVESLNFCRVCHGRVLGENLANAPLWWRGCPYAKFHGH